ncbi:MAG: carboxypeptidase-like regulatory domain-containing protein [Candidatus Dormibacteraceae bacterium]
MKNGRWHLTARASGYLENSHRQFTRTFWAFGVAMAGLVFLPTVLAAKKKPPVVRTISGEVMDNARNGVDGATVELADLETNKTLAIYTINGGQYSFTGLDPHHNYHVQAKYKGMVSRVRTASSINPNNQIVVNLTLAPARQ